MQNRKDLFGHIQEFFQIEKDENYRVGRNKLHCIMKILAPKPRLIVSLKYVFGPNHTKNRTILTFFEVNT